MNTPQVPLVVVGAGPTGLTAATLLGQYGVRCLVLERWDSVYPRPRAAALDDEVYRILARLGIRDEFAATTWPCLGMRLVDRHRRVLAEFSRDPRPGPHGLPAVSFFDQPRLEVMLRANLKRYDTVTVRGGTEVTALTQDDSGQVRMHIADRATGQRETLLARYVLGCDGANSVVRSSVGARMRDLNFTQRWLVLDVDIDTEIDGWAGTHQICDPERAATYMRLGRTRYRWEFQLLAGETVDDYREMARLYPLLSPWTGDIPAAELRVVRIAEYTFQAQIADRWRDRRVFLLGDAAHVTPPFIGQGMGAGLRDAMNLSWKLAGVLDGSLPETVLDTYEIERKPHTRAMIRLSKLVGTAMTRGGRLGHLSRRVLAPRLALLSGVGTGLARHSATPALRRSRLVRRPRLRRSLAGRLCPNALLEDGRRYDEVAGGRFALVTTLNPTRLQQREVNRRGGVLIRATPGTALYRWLRRGRAEAAVVRPDGTVLHAARDLSELCSAMPAFGA